MPSSGLIIKRVKICYIKHPWSASRLNAVSRLLHTKQLRLHHSDQSVTSTWENNRCSVWESHKTKTNCEDNVQSSFDVEAGGTYSNHRTSWMPTIEHRDSNYLEQILSKREEWSLLVTTSMHLIPQPHTMNALRINITASVDTLTLFQVLEVDWHSAPTSTAFIFSRDRAGTIM